MYLLEMVSACFVHRLDCSIVGHGYHVMFLGFNTSLSQSLFHPRLNPGLLRVTGKLSRKTDIKLKGGGGGGQPVIKKEHPS